MNYANKIVENSNYLLMKRVIINCIKIKTSRLRKRRLGSGTDPGLRPSAQGWYAPCKTDYWVASPKVSTLVYLRNLFTDCYPFTAGSTEAFRVKRGACLSQYRKTRSAAFRSPSLLAQEPRANRAADCAIRYSLIYTVYRHKLIHFVFD